MFLIINSLPQSIQANRANIDMCNFINCSIIPNGTSTFKLNGSVEVMSLATRIEQYWNTDFASGDNPCIVLDQYLGKEGLKELSLEERNVSNNDLPKRTSWIDVFNDFQIKK